MKIDEGLPVDPAKRTQALLKIARERIGMGRTALELAKQTADSQGADVAIYDQAIRHATKAEICIDDLRDAR